MSHPPILMYCKPTCPYCVAARKLLQRKGVTWTEVSLIEEPERREEMIARSGRHTVPQIFIGDTHVGGFDDLDALDQEGALNRLLNV
ncbi:glutaredoxin 3 [Wenzhouxiangella marina]|uniref:Glutaredoxin n=1 Tax=Wenzhouxiangella marina TaxID=1579979 RepID=A0A0K0XXI1_9GAMM|nr:glutaredoxin 3 [Wenzhouxiangella marina]AKS42393.1 Glutaredoxin GrxC [Wenzhouxiangella marina]MBB6085833.1 glutaredoxin 3 [Wenzhouxiangella marina]